MKKGFLASAWKTNKGGNSSSPPIKPENENNNSQSHRQTTKPNKGNVSALIEVGERDYKVGLVHSRCNTVVTRMVSKQAFDTGVVVVRCHGCDDFLPIADNAHFFGYKSHDSVEKYFGKLSWLSLPDKGSDSSYCATFRTQDWFRRKTAEMKENNINTPQEVTKEEEEEDLEKALIREGNLTPQALLKLPLEIFLKIISMLTLRPLAVSRSVCKTWLQIISHPTFTKIPRLKIPNFLFQFETNRLIMEEGRDRVGISLLFINPDLHFSIVGSANGLLCLADRATDDPIYVCNPVIGEYFQLPKVGRDGPFRTVCGFGFDELSDKYKAIRLIFYLSDSVPTANTTLKVEAEVYTLGSGQWRNLGDVPYLHFSLLDLQPLRELVNGAFHWLECFKDESVLIVAFNLGREEFQEVPSPPTPRLNRPSWDKKSLGNFRGSLCLLDSTSGFDCVVWLMKDYGVADSWMKQHVISQSINPCVPVSFTLVGVLRTGDMLLLGDSSYTVLYDPTTKTMDETGPLRLGEDEVKFDVLFHVPSFVSLQDIVEPTNRNHKSKMGVWYGKLHPISTNQPEELKMKQKVEDVMMKLKILMESERQ